MAERDYLAMYARWGRIREGRRLAREELEVKQIAASVRPWRGREEEPELTPEQRLRLAIALSRNP